MQAKLIDNTLSMAHIGGRRSKRHPPGNTYPTQRRNEAICSRVLAGETLDSIGEDYGISRQRIYQIIRRNDVKPLFRPGQRKVKPGKITSKILAMNLQTPFTTKDVAKHLGTHRNYAAFLLPFYGYRYIPGFWIKKKEDVIVEDVMRRGLQGGKDE